jgi:4-amino-4-deoxy-L-arabinose transferase-like glycosyltransferase
MFLAACQTILGEQPLAVRLVQAALGALVVWLVYQLTRRLVSPTELEPASGRVCWTVPLIAATLAAMNPYYIAMSELILSEAVFAPLLLLTLWGLAVLWRPADGPDCAGTHFAPWRAALTALGTGATGGAAILTRPSWGLFLPAVLLVWVVQGVRSRDCLLRRRAFQGAVLVVVGVVLMMGPWWVRNARIYGRFVPTALWLGASLYDGLNPEATGASDMAFLADPALRPLDELGQDAALAQRALDFARSNPRRVLELAVIKLGRYWSPWPNASEYRSAVLRVASTLLVVPLYLLLLVGAWIRRYDLRAWLLLAGPVLYFCALHLVFVSSIRYRIPGEPAALGLAAIALRSITDRMGSTFHGS